MSCRYSNTPEENDPLEISSESLINSSENQIDARVNYQITSNNETTSYFTDETISDHHSLEVDQSAGNAPCQIVQRHDKRKRGGDIELKQRSTLKTLKTGHDKIDVLLSIKNELPEKNSLLTEASRNFVVSQLNPIMNCFSNYYYFNDGKDEFVAK